MMAPTRFSENLLSAAEWDIDSNPTKAQGASARMVIVPIAALSEAWSFTVALSASMTIRLMFSIPALRLTSSSNSSESMDFAAAASLTSLYICVRAICFSRM